MAVNYPKKIVFQIGVVLCALLLVHFKSNLQGLFSVFGWENTASDNRRLNRNLQMDRFRMVSLGNYPDAPVARFGKVARAIRFPS